MPAQLGGNLLVAGAAIRDGTVFRCSGENMDRSAIRRGAGCAVISGIGLTGL